MSAQSQPPKDMADDETITVADHQDEPVTLPVVEVLTGRGFITGKSGSGKSNTASVIVEQLLANNFPILIVDTDGEYYGLKEQFEVLHAGADDECDIQVGPEHAEKIATLALEQNVPIILDVSGYLDEDVASDLIKEVAAALFAKEKKLKQPFLLLVEECHEYLPEGPGLDDTGQMLIKIGKRGRKHGLGLVGISQRPADVKKDFITQCDWLVWHRLTWENDVKTARRVLGKEIAGELADLADGEAFVQLDWSDEDVQRMQFRRKQTFDAGATPGLDDFERPELKSLDEGLLEELSEISDRHERRQDKIAELEEKLDEKEDELEQVRKERDRAQDMSGMAEQFTQAMLSGGGGGEAAETAVSEKLEAKDDEIDALEERITALENDLGVVREEKASLQAANERLSGYRSRVEQAEQIEEQLDRAREVLGVEVEEAKGSETPALEDRVAELEAENERLREQGGVAVPDSYEAFVEDEVVKGAIADAKDESSPRYVRAVVAGILKRGGPVTQREVADDIGLQTAGHIGRAMRALAAEDVVSVSGSGDSRTADFDVAAVKEIHERHAREERAEELMQGL